MRPRSATASRSSASSVTVASMRARENSSMSRPCTIAYSPSLRGDRERRDEALGHAVAAVGRDGHATPSRPRACRAPSRARGRWRRWRPTRRSTSPRASMMAAPRCCTVGMNVPSSQAWSSTTSAAVLPFDLGVEEVGVLGGGVVAPDGHVGDVAHGHAGLGGELGHGPVVVEAGHRGEALVGRCPARCSWRSGSWCWPGCRPRGPCMSSAALSERALPWTVKMAPLASSRSLRSMPFDRGREPTSRAQLASSKAVVGVVGLDDAGEQREGAVVELHRDAARARPMAGGISSSCRMTGWSGPSRCAAGDAEEEAVADLAGGSGDGDAYGGLHESFSRWWGDEECHVEH